MSEGILWAICAGFTLLAIFIFLSFRSLEKMRAILPERGLIERLSESQLQLQKAVDTQRRVAEELPRALAGRVASEIGPVAESLKGCHDHLSQTLLTLDQDGSLGEWVEGIRGAVTPLQTLSGAIERHYDTAGRVLQTTSGLVEQWANQRDAVVHAFQRFEASVERAAAADLTHLRDIGDQVNNRLEEVAETNAMVAHSLSELQVASRNALETQAQLARSVDKTTLRTSELIDIAKQTQARHHELIRAQQAIQQDLGDWQQQADQGIKHLREAVGEIAETTASALAHIRKELSQSTSSFDQTIRGFHQSHAKALGQLQARQEAAAQLEGELAQKQQALIADLRQQLSALPERQQLLVATVFLGLQVALTGGVLAALLVG